MPNLSTKPSSRDYCLVARLSILTNMLHEPDLSLARSGTIVCPRTRVTTLEVSPTRYPTPHNTYYVSSLQYKQLHGHELTKISDLTEPMNQTQGSSGSCTMFVEMANISTKSSSRNDGLLDRLSISTHPSENILIIYQPEVIP